jgi:hypothetical protein
MIVGNGDIASVLPKKEDILYFASGVSNSGEKRESEYKREQDLLVEQDFRHHIVYFSSLSIFYSRSRYAKHKISMETVVKMCFPRYTIIRLGNINWGKNPHTIINYFRNEIKANKKIKIKNVYRYIVSKEEFLHWINLIPDWNCEMNIIGEQLLVKDIIRKYILESEGIYLNE